MMFYYFTKVQSIEVTTQPNLNYVLLNYASQNEIRAYAQTSVSVQM